jgi:membrane-associated protease RseP (regulator of RpoE activity)
MNSFRAPGLVQAALFLATVITTTATGAMQLHPSGEIAPIADGLSFSVPLLLILLFHEFGHYIAARLHKVHASLPFFIPLPPWIGLFGTMGAVIKMPGSPTDRRKLIDIGASGPLAGLAVAIPVLLYGLSKSHVLPMSPAGMQEGNSLLYLGLKFLVTGRWLPDGNYDVNLHPTAFAGWAGFLVTMLNLLPFGQLDGGHIMVARFGNRYSKIAAKLHQLLLVLAGGVFVFTYVLVSRAAALGRGPLAGGEPLPAFAVALQACMPWILWFTVVRILRRLGGGEEHPPVDDKELGWGRRVLFAVVVVAFIAIFMPIPLRVSIGSHP